MNIAYYITELLFDHECVIVPGFGGFITADIPAIIRTNTHEFFPPSKKVAFNSGLTANDGLLANHIAISENTTYREAIFEIKNWVDLSLAGIRQGEKFELQGVGTLLLNSSGQVEFEPSNLINFNSDAFGLPVFQAKPVHRAMPETSDLLPAVKRHGRWSELIPATLKWAAVLAPFIAFTLWGSLNTRVVDNYVHNYSGMFSWVRSTPGKTVPANVTSQAFTSNRTTENRIVSPGAILAEKNIRVSPAAISFNELADKKIVITQPAENSKAVVNELKTDYHIICGAFRDHNNAVKLIATLQSQGYPAVIIDTTAKGLYLVSIKGCASATEASSGLREIRNAGFPTAWMLKKIEG